MCKEQNVLNYYVVCNKLKNVIRTGWKDWKVKRERIESVAEHIYGVQMLAIAMKSEYQYDIDMQKVIFMLAIHELGETVIGDLTQFQISREEKERIEHEAVRKILTGLIDGEQIERIFHVKALLESEKTWSGMWLKFGQEKYPYDENFMAVSKYAMKNTLSRCIKSTTVI